jgi:hypothetical protein
MNPYPTLCDDFGVFVYLNTRLDLPATPETVLHFFEGIQKVYPSMTELDRREGGEFILEEDREQGSCRSVGLEPRRMMSAYLNPPTLEDADQQHERLLDFAPYQLDVSTLNCESLDVVFTFDYLYSGNHDEVIAEVLAGNSPLEGLVQLPGSRVVRYEPTLTMALDDKCRLHARLGVESRTTPFQVRQEWGKQPFKTFVESYKNQRRIVQDLVDSYLVPNVLRPLHLTISAK